MNQVAIRNENEPRTSIQNVAFSQGETGGQLAPQSLGDILRFAEVMSRADVAIPKHLRDNPGACLAVCMQAFNWEMNPFAVAQKSYKVNDIIAYEAQLIAAVINTRAGLNRRPQIEYEGDGPERVCIVTFEAVDGSTHIYRSPRFVAITPKNSPLWKSDPDQQQAYYSIRAGARRHFPEVILGVYDRDELDSVRDVTPAPTRSGFATRMTARPQASDEAREGFDGAMVDQTLGARPAPASSTPAPSQDQTAQPDEDAFPGDTAIDPDAPASQHEDGAAPGDFVVDQLLAEAASKFLAIAASDLPGREKQTAVADTLAAWKGEIPAEHHPRLKKVVDRSNDVIVGKSNLPAAVALIAAELGVKEADVQPKVRA